MRQVFCTKSIHYLHVVLYANLLKLSNWALEQTYHCHYLLSSTNEIFWRVYIQLNGYSNGQIQLFTLETNINRLVIRLSLDLKVQERSS